MMWQCRVVEIQHCEYLYHIEAETEEGARQKASIGETEYSEQLDSYTYDRVVQGGMIPE